MKLEHLAIWVTDLEKIKDFYVKYFGMVCGEKYHNPKKKFTSYFLSFKGAASRIELMHREDITSSESPNASSLGLTHFAISVGDKQKVDSLTETLRRDGYVVAGEPRTTGDGYYESIVEDCEGNWIEITV